MKLTFKKEPKMTGLSAIGHGNQSVIIKHNKKQIGIISAPNFSNNWIGWKIGLMVETEQSWKWVFLKKISETEAEAREYITSGIERIIEKNNLKLYYMED